jgi:uncharacterized protein
VRTFALRLLAVLLMLMGMAGAASAAPDFPALSGRVVDQANLLSPEREALLTEKLAALEASTGDQLVVVTLNSLGGDEIETYGYQLGRAWGIGQAETDSGVLLIVAPNERKVRIEVGYGLEPVLTDALSALIIQEQILPAFRTGGFEQGITQGVDAIVGQLTMDRAEAEARAAAVEPEPARIDEGVLAIIGLMMVLFFALTMHSVRNLGRRRRGQRTEGLTPILIWAVSEALRNNDRDGGGGFGGGGFGGGGGFSGGGGSFGGGGASGGW